MADKPDLPASAYSLPHLRIDRFASAKPYRPPRRAMSKSDDGRERFSHGGKLNAELAQALVAAHRMLTERDESLAAGKAGAYVEIASETGKTSEFVAKRWDEEAQGAWLSRPC